MALEQRPLEQRQYSLLVVSRGDRFNRALEGLLPGAFLSQTHFAGSLSEGRRVLSERVFDFVLVNSPLPDGTGVGFAIDLAGELVAVVAVKAEIHDEVYLKAAPHGVFTLSKPASRAGMEQALRWMVSARERLRRAERKSLSLEEKMAEIRLVNRAKWALIRERGMDEPEAHRYLERRAMDLCATKAAVAREVLGEKL